jgi:hypothetical protein
VFVWDADDISQRHRLFVGSASFTGSQFSACTSNMSVQSGPVKVVAVFHEQMLRPPGNLQSVATCLLAAGRVAAVRVGHSSAQSQVGSSLMQCSSEFPTRLRSKCLSAA